MNFIKSYSIVVGKGVFRSGSSTVWLGKEKEKRILETCGKHLSEIVKTVAGMRKTVYAFHDLDTKSVKEAFNEVFAREREADGIKRKIIEELSKGIFHPIDREEIVRLILTAEDVADNAKEAARKLSFILPKKISKNLRKGLKDFSDGVHKTAELTSSTFKMLMEKPNEALKLADLVEKAEEKMDDLRAGLLVSALTFCDRSKSAGTSLMLKEIIDNMENVADRCEDVADVIRGIAISGA